MVYSIKMNHTQRDSEHGSSIGEKSPNLVESISQERGSQQDQGQQVSSIVQLYADKFGFEERGIERVLPNERTDAGMSKIGTLWMSANMTVSTFAIGALAHPVFDLGFVDTVLTIIFVNIFSILPVCFFSTLIARFGLRQMVLSRFWFGFYGVKLGKSNDSL